MRRVGRRSRNVYYYKHIIRWSQFAHSPTHERHITFTLIFFQKGKERWFIFLKWYLIWQSCWCCRWSRWYRYEIVWECSFQSFTSHELSHIYQTTVGDFGVLLSIFHFPRALFCQLRYAIITWIDNTHRTGQKPRGRKIERTNETRKASPSV